MKQPASALRVRTLGLAFLFVLGCNSDPNVQSALVDDVGRDVHLPREVRRIVSLAPSMTEIAFSAGLGDRIVGVTTADDYPEAVRVLPRVSVLPVDFEAVASLRPDLILATDHVNSTRDARTFDRLGIPIYFFRFEEISDIPRAIRLLGRLTETEETTDAASRAFEADLASIRVSSESDAPSVLFLVSSEILYSVGRGSYVNDMIAAAGGLSVTAEVRSPAPVLTEEFVLDVNPDVIIGTFGADFSIERLVRERPSWVGLEAVQHGRVYSAPSDPFHRPGPRVLQGITFMKDLLHDD